MKLTTEQIAELESDLLHFCGSEKFYRYSPLFPSLLLTEGIKYLAEKAGCFWLIDIIGSYQPQLREEEFQVWTLKVIEHKPDAFGFQKSNGGVVICDDGGIGENDPLELVRQELDYTDFPLKEIKLYAEYGDGYMIVMLPQER